MPELPEVETTIRGLRKFIVGQPIKEAHSETPQLFESRKLMQQIGSLLSGDTITSLSRRGKYLLFHLASGRVMVMHMKMAGRFLATKKDHTARHARFQVDFMGGVKMVYYDPRKFGRIWLMPESQLDLFFTKRKFAHDALSPLCTEAYLKTQLFRGRAVKTLLLDQTCVAGIGNIYADEILWAAQVHPLRKGSSLSTSEVRRVFHAMGAILKEAIKAGGTSLRDYARPDGGLGSFQSRRRVYQRTGEPCPRCKTKITRLVVSQRGTHVCPTCQRP
jgi:formamidopyrimidine-DNA glycosylase